ncbi:hypothetical protein JCM18899A_30630 [Nocardioides sp. AN3]
MTDGPARGRLRLDPPSVVSDASLAARLADLARASKPSASPVARRRWHLPVAGAAIVLATGGATFAAGQVRQHDEPRPTIVPAEHLAPTTTAPASAAPVGGEQKAPTPAASAERDGDAPRQAEALTPPTASPRSDEKEDHGRSEHSEHDETGEQASHETSRSSGPSGDDSGKDSESASVDDSDNRTGTRDGDGSSEGVSSVDGQAGEHSG